MEVWRTLSGALWVRAAWSHPVRGAIEYLKSEHPAVRFRREINAWEVPTYAVPLLIELLERDGWSQAADAIPDWTPARALEVLPAALILDVESTALRDGSPFLVGLRDPHGQVRQLWLTSANEADVLRVLAEQVLTRAPAILTFGGDSYHLVALMKAMKRHGITGGIPWERSVDLVQFAYQLRHRGEIPNARHRTVEVYYGYERSPVLPSSAVPDLYVQAEAGSETARQQILALNRADLASVAAIAERLIRGEQGSHATRADLERTAAAEAYLRAKRRADEALSALLAVAQPGDIISTESGPVRVTDSGVEMLPANPAAS